ncbi:hypothetical protein AAVH_36172 [Aphelenchoides avenae]|nr:hypothetical protein AAVH_36172 [Aphelenchus avenae]
MRPHENELEPSSPMGPPKIIAPPQSILKDRHGRHGSVERRRSRHASSESSGPPTPRAVTFDKSVYNFRSVASESEVMPRPSQRTLRDRRTSLPVASHAQLLSRAPVSYSPASLIEKEFLEVLSN